MNPLKGPSDFAVRVALATNAALTSSVTEKTAREEFQDEMTHFKALHQTPADAARIDAAATKRDRRAKQRLRNATVK